MNLVVKIGRKDIIRREASFYLRARLHQGLPMLADFGAFDIDGSNGCALILELATPMDDGAHVCAIFVHVTVCLLTHSCAQGPIRDRQCRG